MNAKDTYKVISYNPRRRVCISDVTMWTYYYRWYWQAEIRSWINCNLFFHDCATYLKDGADVKPRPVVWK